MATDYVDASGRELIVGDYVCYPTSTHSTPNLKFGRIVRLKRAAVRMRPWVPDLGRVIPLPGDPPPAPPPPTPIGSPKLGLISAERTWHSSKNPQWRLVKNGQETTAGILDSVLRITVDQLPAGVADLLEKPIP